MNLLKSLATGLTAACAAAALALTTMAAPASAAPSMNRSGMSPDTATVASIILSNEKTAFDYFVAKGLSKIHSAGIIGNLDQESGMDPTIHQSGGGAGRGIAQWSVGGRWDTYSSDNVVWYANKYGRSATSLSLQLDFVWYELHAFSYYGLSSLTSSTTINGAVVAFQDHYEGCGTCNTSARETYAHNAYNRYA